MFANARQRDLGRGLARHGRRGWCQASTVVAHVEELSEHEDEVDYDGLDTHSVIAVARVDDPTEPMRHVRLACCR